MPDYFLVGVQSLLGLPGNHLRLQEVSVPAPAKK